MASVSVSDNFNRADANPIGGVWTPVPGSSPVQLVSNQAASTTSGNYSTVYWTPDTFGPDQFSQITAVTQFHLAYAVVRASTTANTYYLFRGGASTPWRLFKMIAGVPTQIGSDYAAAVSGQVIKLQVIGNVLTPFINGVAQASVTDSSIATGQPGFGMYDTNGFIDNWSAGPAGVSVVATPTVDKPAGTYPGSVTVTISDTTPGAVMCYRTDGIDPTATTPGTCDAGSTTYAAPVTLNASATLKVLGTEATFANSAVLTQVYVVRGPASWYVSNAGSDANSGVDAAHPWAHAPGMTGATGVAASTVLLPGDSILLNRGDSWLNTTLTVPAGGSAGSPITLSAYGTGAKPIVSAAANSPAITVTAANMGYWIIDGLDLRASGLISGINLPASIYHNYWSSDMLPVPNWIVQNCVSNASFYLSGPNTIVRGNVLDGTPNSSPPFGGIILRSQVNTNGLVEANNVSHFKDRGIWINRGANNVVIRYNTVHDIIAGSDNQGMGINLDGFEIPVTGAQTYGNLIYNCAGIGITHENSQGSKAFYNLLHDCVQAGIDVINYSSFQTQPTNVEITYNIIYNTNVGIMVLDAQTVAAIGNTLCNGTGANSFAFGIWTPDTNVFHLTFKNNIVGGTWTHPIQVRTAKAVWDVFDYNDIVPSAGGEVLFQADTSVSQTLAQLQALGLMIHGLTADPKFKSTVTPDFSLQPGSPAIGTGVNLGAAYQQVPMPSSVWPSQIVLAAQPAAWNMGGYGTAPTYLIVPPPLVTGKVKSRVGTIAAGSGIYKRGTIVHFDPPTLVITPGDTFPNAIVAEDCDARASSGLCIVYLQGKFRADAIIWPSTGTAAAITDQLRDLYIFIESAVSAADPTNQGVLQS